jgi:hypothetical protein
VGPSDPIAGAFKQWSFCLIFLIWIYSRSKRPRFVTVKIEYDIPRIIG